MPNDYILKHHWPVDPPELKDIPQGCFAEFNPGYPYWRIMTSETKSPLPLVHAKENQQ